MTTLSVDDLILEPAEYAEQRRARRAEAIALRRDRRVSLGDVVLIEFENAATLGYLAQEMLYVERVTDPAAAAAEVAVYERLLPSPQRLTATMMIQIADQDEVRGELARLDGIHTAVTLTIDGHEVATREIPPPEEGPSEHTYTVHFLGFDLPSDAITALQSGGPAYLAIDHPAYRARVDLDESLIRLLAADLHAAAG